jgi:thiamine-phosphate pyrophosphorylase
MGYSARLILFAPREENAEAVKGCLADAFAGGRIDAVILPLAGQDERAQINYVKAIAPIVQEAGSALLLADALELVARTGADGVHLTSPDRAVEAIAAMRRIDRSVGVGGLKARHDAMEVAEWGADYVMFGEPRADQSLPTLSMVEERAGWWAELFNTPCVVFASEDAHIAPLVATGAEFVALALDPAASAEERTARVHKALQIIAETPAPQHD